MTFQEEVTRCAVGSCSQYSSLTSSWCLQLIA
jgi:hypothetical protein